MDPNLIEQARRQINRLAEEIAHMSEMDLAPEEYYREFLSRLLTALAAPAGAIWLRTGQGHFQLQYQANMREVGVDRTPEGRASHDELLRQVATKAQPALMMPQSGLGAAENGQNVPAGNPTDYVNLLVPIIVEKAVAGLIEVWQDPARGIDAQRGFLKYMGNLANFAAGYTRNQQMRQMSGQQQIWTQLEAFTRQIHSSLVPTEVAYIIANEGRRLAECDRLSIAVHTGRKPHIEAISGADVVERRSNLVQHMRALLEAVMNWGEPLVYSGTKDEALPPRVLQALDTYLVESNSKFLIALPLRDEREKNLKKPPRSALLLESFEPTLPPAQIQARLDVIARHATPCLYNALEHQRIPFRFLWMPLAKLQDGLGGKTQAIISLSTFAAIALLVALIVVPYPLRMEANGQLLPKERKWIFATLEGRVVGFKPFLLPGSTVTMNQELVQMFSLDLHKKLEDFRIQRDQAKDQVERLGRQLQKAEMQQNIADLINQKNNAEVRYRAAYGGREALSKETNANLQNPGEFWLKAPLSGIVMTNDFRETLLNRTVKPNEQLLRIGYISAGKATVEEWEIELKIPQRHIGQVRAALARLGPKAELDVDLLVLSHPTRTFRGKLAPDKLAREANPDRTAQDEAEPMVIARVRIDGDDIAEEYRITPEVLLTAGTGVRARVRCGYSPMGYSLFYGVWEFLYEKVVFFLF